MYIGNGNQASLGRVRHETLRRWVEELLASEQLDAAAADDVRDAVTRSYKRALSVADHHNSIETIRMA
jgi:hypothetical protein